MKLPHTCWDYWAIRISTTQLRPNPAPHPYFFFFFIYPFPWLYTLFILSKGFLSYKWTISTIITKSPFFWSPMIRATGQNRFLLSLVSGSLLSPISKDLPTNHQSWNVGWFLPVLTVASHLQSHESPSTQSSSVLFPSALYLCFTSCLYI